MNEPVLLNLDDIALELGRRDLEILRLRAELQAARRLAEAAGPSSREEGAAGD